MFSNLYKAGFVHLGEDARVIDMNAILEKRLKEEAERRSRQPEHELVAAQDGFTEGLNAEKVDVLLEPDEEAASLQNASIQEQSLQKKLLDALYLTDYSGRRGSSWKDYKKTDHWGAVHYTKASQLLVDMGDIYLEMSSLKQM